MNTNARNGHPLKYFVDSLGVVGKALWYVGCIEIFPDCDATSYIFNKWNPLSYVAFLIQMIAIGTVGGATDVKEAWTENRGGFAFTKYWNENRDRIEFISRLG